MTASEVFSYVRFTGSRTVALMSCSATYILIDAESKSYEVFDHSFSSNLTSTRGRHVENKSKRTLWPSSTSTTKIKRVMLSLALRIGHHNLLPQGGGRQENKNLNQDMRASSPFCPASREKLQYAETTEKHDLL